MKKKKKKRYYQMDFSNALLTYLPTSIVKWIQENKSLSKKEPPYVQHSYKTACVFADISGFTRLSENMHKKGIRGDEILAKHLNSYFELLLRIINSEGGDVLKFSGDALLVVWPRKHISNTDEKSKLTEETEENILLDMTRRASQCALEIQAKCQEANITDDITLNVKVGIGIGSIKILHVGGVFERLEYIPTGTALQDAFLAEQKATKTETIIISPKAWNIISKYFIARPINSRKSSSSNSLDNIYMTLKSCKLPLRKISVFRNKQNSYINHDVLGKMMKYIPGAILPYVNKNEEKWANELRRISVLFINLGMRLVNVNQQKDVERIQKIIKLVQTQVYRYEGSLNKFIMDDKGSTLLVVFGLPPLSHSDDPTRASLCALAISQKLKQFSLSVNVGVSSGIAFCGICGSRGRREYTVLGDTVNLAARLMQYATAHNFGVICDNTTQYIAKQMLHFQMIGDIAVKGKQKAIRIYHPYPLSFEKILTPVNIIRKKNNTRQSRKSLQRSSLYRRMYSEASIKIYAEKRIAAIDNTIIDTVFEEEFDLDWKISNHNEHKLLSSSNNNTNIDLKHNIKNIIIENDHIIEIINYKTIKDIKIKYGHDQQIININDYSIYFNGILLHDTFSIKSLSLFILNNQNGHDDEEKIYLSCKATNQQLLLDSTINKSSDTLSSLLNQLIQFMLNFVDDITYNRYNTNHNLYDNCILIEGNYGVGKSRLLKLFTEISPLLTFSTRANPYEIHHSLRIWTDLIGTMIDDVILDSEIMNNNNDALFIECKKTWITKQLSKNNHNNQSLKELIPCLNEIF